MALITYTYNINNTIEELPLATSRKFRLIKLVIKRNSNTGDQIEAFEEVINNSSIFCTYKKKPDSEVYSVLNKEVVNNRVLTNRINIPSENFQISNLAEVECLIDDEFEVPEGYIEATISYLPMDWFLISEITLLIESL